MDSGKTGEKNGFNFQIICDLVKYLFITMVIAFYVIVSIPIIIIGILLFLVINIVTLFIPTCVAIYLVYEKNKQPQGIEI